jgi:glycosyltransferase involved in cell wall biosynthesis
MGKDKNLYKICIDRLLALFSHGIICNSHKSADNLKRKYHFNRKKIFTVHNGINGINFLKGSNCDSENNELLNSSLPKIVGTIGRLCPQKNHRLFLYMAKIVINKSQNKNLRFWIVGGGALKNELENYARRLGIEENVVFTGERSDIPSLLHSMDIFVMTSLYEGLSNTIMEAMLAGLPVVATDVGGNSELIIDGETGFFCPSGDAKALARKVVHLIDNETEAQQMGENGKNRIINNFGIEKMVRETENVYFTLIKQFIKSGKLAMETD